MISSLAGGSAAATIGAVASGGTTIGAATAFNEDMNNRQLHLTEAQKLAALKKGKSAVEQHQLDAAACALVQCANGVPKSDAHYDQLSKLQDEGKLYPNLQKDLLSTGEFIHDGKWDSVRDDLTRKGESLRRVGGLINLSAGSVGTVVGSSIGVTGAASCMETLGFGCLVGALGGYIAKTSSDQAFDGSRAAFGKYTSNEGQRVLDSFNLQTYPGENDPIWNALRDGAKLGAGVLLYKYGPKLIASIEERFVAEGAAAGVKGSIKEVPATNKTATSPSSSEPPPKAQSAGGPKKPMIEPSSTATNQVVSDSPFNGAKVGKGASNTEAAHIDASTDVQSALRQNPPGKTATSTSVSESPPSGLPAGGPKQPVIEPSPTLANQVGSESGSKVEIVGSSIDAAHIGAAIDAPTATRWNPSGKDQNCIACVGSYMTDKEGMLFMTADDIERSIASVDPSRGIQLQEAVRIIRAAAQAEKRPQPLSPFLEGSPAGDYALFLGPDRNALKHVIYAERFENGSYRMFDPQNGKNVLMEDLMSLRIYWGGSHNSPLVPVFIKGAKE